MRHSSMFAVLHVEQITRKVRSSRHTCAQCGGKINRKADMVELHGKLTFHKSCFMCVNCGTKLKDEYMMSELKPHCLPCMKTVTPTCASCSLPIKGASQNRFVLFSTHFLFPSFLLPPHALLPLPFLFITCDCVLLLGILILCFESSFFSFQGAVTDAMGKKWHPEHFCCSHCHRPLNQMYDTGAFFVESGKPYCCEDYYELFGKRCSCGCKETIISDLLMFKGQPYKPHHFHCSRCNKDLAVLEPDKIVAVTNKLGQWFFCGSPCLKYFTPARIKSSFGASEQVCFREPLMQG